MDLEPQKLICVESDLELEIGRIAQNWEGFLQWSRFVQKASGDARSDAGNRGEQKRPRSE